MSRKGSRRSGQAMILVVMLGTFFFSMAGLATDFVWAYVIKQRLVTAVDAAALAAVRSLGRGPANIDRVVSLAFDSNFPSGYMLATGVSFTQPVVSTPAPGVRAVDLTGSAIAPMFFLRIWGFENVAVSASATASRRDVNLIVVLDRSASLHPMNANAWAAVQSSSTFFVQQFDDTRDQVGLVTFGSNARVDVPAGLGTNAAVVTAIDDQLVGESAATNSPHGLWLAYAELIRLNDPNAINAVVFFTDGQPTAFTASFPVRTAPSGTSTTIPYCGASPREASIAALQSGADFYEILGFWNPLAATTPVTLAPAGGYMADFSVVSGCNNPGNTFAPTASNVEQLFDPGVCLPTEWNATHAPAGGGPVVSRTFSLTTGPYTVNSCSSGLKSTSTTWANRLARGTFVHNASKNLTVNIASAARQNPSLGEVRIYAVGLGGWGFPADHDFLRRVANDPDSPTFTTAEPSGLYVYAPGPAQLQQAFNNIASEIFRLLR